MKPILSQSTGVDWCSLRLLTSTDVQVLLLYPNTRLVWRTELVKEVVTEDTKEEESNLRKWLGEYRRVIVHVVLEESLWNQKETVEKKRSE